ncbi:MAG TPA: hypothetical protein VJM51_00545 [Dehalococcoidia bacterium]|nr:hypothetical protein [Dehalococcoidia bacterium]
MARYFVASPHTPEDCLQALDEVLEQGPQLLAEYEWGCMAGDHTGYLTIEASSGSEAQNAVPSFIRSKARIVATNKFTPDQIRSFHQKGL